MTTKHTPGPWTLDNRATTAIQAGDKHVAMVNFSFLGRPERDVYGEEHDANARLIAAAPDMLDALEAEEHAQSLEEEYGMFQRTWTSDERAEKWRDVEAARYHAGKLRTAALAKAKGR